MATRKPLVVVNGVTSELPSGDGISTSGPTTITNNSSGNAVTITQTGTGNALVVEDSASTDSSPFVIDANGYVVSGSTQAYNAGTIVGVMQTHTTNVLIGGPSGYLWSNDVNGIIQTFSKSRGATVGTHTILQVNDAVAQHRFYGSTGTTFVETARTSIAIDGTPGTNAMPGRLIFSTTRGGQFTISSIARASNVVTVTASTTVAGLIAVNDSVVIAGVTDTGFNGTFTITSIPTATTFTFAQTAADAASSGGTATVGIITPTERLRIDSAGAVGIGTSLLAGVNLRLGKDITGGTTGIGGSVLATFKSDVTSVGIGWSTSLSTENATYTLGRIDHFSAFQSTFGASSTITAQVGFRVDASLIGATSNYGFFSAIPSGTGRWNFYAAGTATNYFNGQTSIGTASPSASAKLQVDSTTQGFLPPRMTTTQRDAVTSPEPGLTIYNTTLGAQQYFNGSSWINAGIEGAGTGDMTKAVYDTDNDGIVDLAEVANAVAWNNVTDKPTTFTPSTHTHVISDVTDLQTSLNAIQPAVGAITKDMSGWPNRTDTSISFDNATRTFTLSRTGATATYYYRGEAKTLSTNPTFQITNTNGGRYIHLDPTNNTLYDGGSTGSYDSAVLVGYVYWSTTDGAAFIVGDERHSSSRDTTWHLAQHLNVGTVWRSGGALTYTLDNDSAVNIALGDITIADEDLTHTIVHAASPDGFYQQVLSGSANLPVLYYSGTEWRQFAATTVPWRPGTSLAQYNPISGGTGSLSDATEGSYINYWLFATNDKNFPVKLIIGRVAHASTEAALTEEFSNLGLSLAENVPLYQIVLQTSSAYTGNTAKVRLKYVRKVVDRVSVTSSSFSATSHSALTNRSDTDSHPISAITNLQSSLDGKQATLVSGTNIKTINGSSVLGSGNLTVTSTVSLTSAQQALSADVQMPTTGTWYDGPSISLSEGTWLVNSSVTFLRSATTATQWITRISTGTTHYASGQAYTASVSGITTQINLSAVITLGAVTTIKIQSTTSAGATACLMKAATPASGSGNNATIINAIKIA